MKKWNISRVPLQGRPLLLPWITWASAKCQLSGLLREAGAGLEKPPLWPFREPRELTRNWRGGTRGNRAMPAPWWAFQLLFWYHLSAHYFFHCKVVYSNFSGSLLCNTGVCVCVCMNGNYCLYSCTTVRFEYRNMLSKCYQTQIFIHIWNADRECSCLHVHNKQQRNWMMPEKSRQALRASGLANTNQFHCVFVFWSTLTELLWHTTSQAGVWLGKTSKRVTLA